MKNKDKKKKKKIERKKWALPGFEPEPCLLEKKQKTNWYHRRFLQAVLST